MTTRNGHPSGEDIDIDIHLRTNNVPDGDGDGLSFNPEVLMVRSDGTKMYIPLNVDGFYPSRQYDHDPVIYDGEASIDFDVLMDVDLDEPTTPSDGGGDVPPVGVEGGGGTVLERVHVHMHGLAAAGIERATQAFQQAVRGDNATEGEEEREDNNNNDDDNTEGTDNTADDGGEPKGETREAAK